MTEEEKKQLVDAVITRLKNEGTDVSSASVVEDVNGVSYVLCYDTNGNIVRVSPDTINQQESATKEALEAVSVQISKLAANAFSLHKMDGYVYNWGNGKLVPTSYLNGQCSEKIACLPNKLYYIKNVGLVGIRLIFWDSENNYISSTTYSNDTYNKKTPENAAYLAVFTSIDVSWDSVFVEDITDVGFIRIDFSVDAHTTRNSIPFIFRKQGLTISYVTDKGEKVIETYSSSPEVYLNNAYWGNNDNYWERVVAEKDVIALNQEVEDVNAIIQGELCSVEEVTPNWTSGYHINAQGKTVEFSGFRYSDSILLRRGDKLEVYGRGNASTAIISLLFDGAYKPLVLGTNSMSPERFYYTAEVDCEVVVCSVTDSSYYVRIISNYARQEITHIQDSIGLLNGNSINLIKSKNLLNPNTSVIGLLRATGNISETMTKYLTSDYIDVEPNKNYTISTSAGKVYCYGEYLNERIINYQTPDSTQINITTSSITNRIRIGYINTAISVQVEKGDAPTSYEPYNKPTKLGTDKEGRPVLAKAEGQFIIDSSPNLIVLETFTEIGYHKWDGTYIEEDKYRTSNNTIGLEGGKTYSHNFAFVSFKLYDENMQPMGYQYNPTSPFIAKSGAKFAEVSVDLKSLSTLNCILVEGETIPDEIGNGHFPIIKKDRESGMDVVAILGDKKPVQKNFWYKKKYASLGDSITYRDQWQRIVDFHLGTTHVNFACSGMTVGGYAFHFTTGGSEDGGQIGQAVADRLLNADDFADCQLIIICGYANNAYGNGGTGSVIGTMEDEYKTISEEDITNYSSVNEYRKSITGQTFIAACRSTIEYVQKVAPHARIVVSGQFLMDTSYLPNYDSNNIDLHRKNGQGLDTVAYSEAMKEVAEYYALPYVDLAKKGGVNNMNWHLYYPASDQVHPNFANYAGGEDYPDSGMYKMARGIIGVLESI